MVQTALDNTGNPFCHSFIDNCVILYGLVRIITYIKALLKVFTEVIGKIHGVFLNYIFDYMCMLYNMVLPLGFCISNIITAL